MCTVKCRTDRLKTMKRMRKFSVVRVYSKSLEQTVFPIPRTLKVTRKCVVPPDEIDHVEPPETVLLHRLIRDQKCPVSETISIMDMRIEVDPIGVSIADEELDEYRRQIAEAEKHVLTNADVILCTCTESASKRIRKATNVLQVKYLDTLCLYTCIKSAFYRAAWNAVAV